MTLKQAYYLVRIVRGIETECLEMKEGITKIGRSNNQDVRCLSIHVSREHCAIQIKNGIVHIKDTGSSNGTFVADVKITSSPYTIDNGALIGLGAVPDEPSAAFVFRLFITVENDNQSNGIIQIPLREGNMFKNLKRKSTDNESVVSGEIKYLPLAKRSRNGKQHIISPESSPTSSDSSNDLAIIDYEEGQIKKENFLKCIKNNLVINLDSSSNGTSSGDSETNSQSNEDDAASIEAIDTTNITKLKQVINDLQQGVINLDSDTDSDVQILCVEKNSNLEKENNDVLGIVVSSDEGGEEISEQKDIIDVKQSSFSLTDEIIWDDSDNEEQSASQLFSQRLETSSLSEDNKLPLTAIVKTEGVCDEIDNAQDDNVYDDEDHPLLDDSISGMFEEHFIHCSQEINDEFVTFRKSSKKNNFKAPDIIEEKGNDIQQQGENKIATTLELSNKSMVINLNDSSKHVAEKTIEERLPGDERAGKALKLNSESSKKKKLSILNKENSSSRLTDKISEAFLTKAENLDQKNYDKNIRPIEVENVYANDDKVIPETRSGSITKQEPDKRYVALDLDEDKLKELKISLDLKLDNVKRKTHTCMNVKPKISHKKKLETKNHSLKKKLIQKSGRIEPKYEPGKRNEKLKEERREKLRSIALKNKTVNELKTKLDQDCTVQAKVKLDTEQVAKDTVKISDRSKPINYVVLQREVVKPQKIKKKNYIKQVNDKSVAEPKEKIKPETRRSSAKENEIIYDTNINKTIEEDSTESIKERINKLKGWELNIIKSSKEDGLELSTDIETPQKCNKVVRFKRDLVEVRTYVCEGNLVRKVSDKENRPRREIPPQQKSLEQLTWRTSLKTSYIIFDMCKWNVKWLEECKGVKGDPPVVKMQYLQVKNSYISYKDYYQTMYPLLMLEFWKETYQELELQSKGVHKIRNFNGVIRNVMKNPQCVNQNNSSDGRRLITVSCVFVGSRDECRRTIAPDEGDFGIMQVTIPGAKKQIYNTFVFVSSDMKSVPFRHCNDHFANYVVKNFLDQNSKHETCFYVQLSFCDSPNKPVGDGYILKLRILRNIYKNLRIFDSLTRLTESVLLEYILNPSSIVRPKSSKHFSNKLACNFPLNKTQADVVLEVTKDLLSGKPSISLIHGPPGTGKSRVIVSLVLQLLSNNAHREKGKKGVREKILLCAPSNAAIDSLALRLLEIRQALPNEKRFKLIRVGPPNTIHKTVRDISSYNLAAKEVGNSLDEDNLNIELRLLTAEERSLSYAIEHSKHENGRQKFTAELAALQERKRNLEYVVNNNCSGYQANAARTKLIYESEMKVIQGAEIVATTLSSCCSRKIINALGESLNKHFTYCIIDEATQGIEQEVLLPLLHNIKGLVLVGDPLQLAPTILSETCKKYNLGCSVYHRIWREWTNNGSIESRPFYKLIVQNRMHPEIAQFPAQHFYNNNLVTPDFLNVQLPFSPYNVLTHCFKEDTHGESNYGESDLVVKLLIGLNKAVEFKGLSVGVIVPYQCQKQLIETTISKLTEVIKYTKVNTVDSFQGQEKDIIIFSCVRTDGVGFLSDKLRVNVALTRARKCLIVLANFNSLQNDNTWQALFMDAKSRSVTHNVPSSLTDPVQLVELIKYKDKRNKSC